MTGLCRAPGPPASRHTPCPSPGSQPKQKALGKEARETTSHSTQGRVELETVTLRLPAQLVRAVEQYAKYLGGSTDRTYVITQAIEIALQQDAEFQKTLSSRPAAV